MKTEPKIRRPLHRLVKVLFVGFGGLAILLAVGLGVFRLLLAQIPEYQTELRTWVAAELGLAVDFAALDARLGLRGPELSLRQATIGSGREFLQAERATITLDPVALIFSRQIDVLRLTLDGVRLTVERDAGGTFRLGDFAPMADGSGIGAAIPPSVEVAIRDSELIYVDSVVGQDWRFTDLEIVIESTGQTYAATAALNPPPELAGRLDLRVEIELPAAGAAGGINGLIHVGAESLDLATLAALISIDAVPAIDGLGAVDLEVEWTGSAITAALLDLDVNDLTLTAAAGDPFDRVRLRADWRRLADDGDWQLRLDEVDITRNGRAWDSSGSAMIAIATDRDAVQAVGIEGDFVRLEDLQPLVAAWPESPITRQWAQFDPQGDIRDFRFSMERRSSGFDYDLDTLFEQLASSQVGRIPGIEGVTGEVHATEDSGTVRFQTEAFVLDWPALFGATVEAESLAGEVTWRQSRDAINILSAYLGIGILGQEARASFNLELPHDGSSPTLDLDAELATVDVVAAKRYLPRPVIPAAVVDWLDRAVIGGAAHDIELELVGPLDAFPFDNGRGQFRVAAEVEDVSLDYMSEWPIADDVDGWIEFVNAGFFAGASGQVGGNRSENFELSMPDLRNPILSMSADTDGALADVLAYLRSAPLIAERLGPGFERIEALGGTGSIGARLDMPLRDLAAFDLDAVLTVAGGAVAVRGMAPAITEIDGRFTADADGVAADGVDGIFLGGPISISLGKSDRSGYRAELFVDGETSVGAISEAFGFSPTATINGQTRWQGRLLLPVLDSLATMPTRIIVDSNLGGIALDLPEPLTKPPGEPVNLGVSLSFLTGNRIEVNGNLGATRRFTLDFQVENDRLRFSGGAVEFGGGEPRLPVRPGVLVGGRIETLELDQWLALAGTSGIRQAGTLFLGAEIEVASLHAFGQRLGSTSLRVVRNPDDWTVDIDSQAIAGEIVVPRGTAGRDPIVADMTRVYLATAEATGLIEIDPQGLPGLRLEADEFGFGNRQLGSVSAIVEPVPRGLALAGFRSRTPYLETEISGSWLGNAGDSRTTLDVEIRSTDVAAALTALGIDPVVDGETAAVTASLYWDSAPTSAWLEHLYGNVGLAVETGTLREIDPGAGRVLGLMSIAALPRRLQLDFRDVFEEGFAFDEITGNFTIIDGNAFTNDLKFGGPGAEIGVVGRTGLRDQDYRQQVVVTAEPGNMLPTVGGLLGGAGVGAALLIFTRLFKEQLKGIGRASYCLSGNWEAPTVEPIEDDESEAALLCAELPEEMRPGVVDE